MKLTDIYPLLKKTLSDWIDDKAPTFAAALAYYTVFSIAPLLIIAVAVSGLVFGEEAAHGEIRAQLQSLVGSSGAAVIEDMMVNASKPSSSILATIVGVVVLFFGATGAFVELQEFLNHIWNVKPSRLNGIVDFFRVRLLSFSMVLGVAFLLLVSLIISAGLSALGHYFNDFMPGSEIVWQVVDIVVSLAVITMLFAMIYKVLPDVQVQWRDVWLGAFVTAVLFSVGKFAIGYYLGKTSAASSYGAAGSVAIILLWVYYSAQVLFIGAEFTQVFARYKGHHPQRKALAHDAALETV